ncbi:MAG: hypothetical protein CM15mP29_2630 [Alphaproteobacteria bacterium]|nr:MAG: hypothetical protein CM15mP29_2630 [Alphaproteobacteria bacterium]
MDFKDRRPALSDPIKKNQKLALCNYFKNFFLKIAP